MDTNKLKRFATEARNILMQGVRNRLQAMGFDLTSGRPIEMPQAMEGGAVFMGDIVSTDFYRRWMSLYNNVSARGIKQVAEEAAYTWFNRLVAIRIMQKQGFISPVLAYESDEVRVPIIVSEARQGRMPQMAADVHEKLTELLDDDSKTNEQFALLIVAYCHENPIINKCFGNIADYTELLLPQNILANDGFVSMLNQLSNERDEDFRSAELIGWLYQFYISDRKDEAFAKKGKYDADEIAPATQIFTPNWIVKYMVENTVGRIYVDNNPYCEVKDTMKYLVGGAVSHCTTDNTQGGAVSHCANEEKYDNADNWCGGTPHLLSSAIGGAVSHCANDNTQGGAVSHCANDNTQGGAVSHCANANSSSCGGTPHLLCDDLADLTVADLACGSGHILNECFDLLYNIYVEEGYSRTQAITNILRKNILGIDLDTRAKQLATFALLMKACQKDSSFLDGRIMPRVYDMPRPIGEAIAAEGDGRTAEEYLRDTLPHYLLGGNDEMMKELTDAILLMNHANTLGSIMKFDIAEQTRNAVMVRTEEYEELLANGEIVPSAIQLLMPYMRIILALTDKYAALCMNPPYMGSGRFDEVLSKYVKENYKDGKADLATVFVEMMGQRTAVDGKYAFIIPPSWMFLSTFEGLRKNIIENKSIESLLHLSRGVFGADFGASSAVIKNTRNEEACGTYFRLVERTFQEFEQSHLRMLFEQTLANHDFKYNFKQYTKDVTELPYSEDGNRIYYPNVAQKNFEKIPGEPIGYWVSEKMIGAFEGQELKNTCETRCGMATGRNDYYLRNWYEVSNNNVFYSCNSVNSSINSDKKWYPYDKAGEYRKWYGNRDYIVNWYHNGNELQNTMYPDGSRVWAHNFNLDKLFLKHIGWSDIISGTGGLSFRLFEEGFLFDGSANAMFEKDNQEIPFEYLLAYSNSCIPEFIRPLLNPTIHFKPGNYLSLPFKYVPSHNITDIALQNIVLSRLDWDSHETSWDFEENPLVALANRIGGAVSHRTTEGNYHANALQESGETPLLLKGGAVSHRTTEGNYHANTLQESGETPLLLKGGAVSHRTTEGNYHANALQGSGETPLLLEGGAVSHCTTEDNYHVNALKGSGETPLLLKGGAVSHCATKITSGNAADWCGETPHLLKFVNKREYIDIVGSKLPHWNQTGCVQFVTFRLADSLPQAKLMEYRQMKEEWLALHPKPWDEATQDEYDSTIGNKIDKWLDAGYGSCMLQDEAARRIVEDSILHFNGEKYCLYAYVIMPNHVHVLLTPGDGNTIQGIVGGWKKFTAHEINKQLNREGAVWERECFDRMVRSNDDFEAKLNYIADNPQHLPASAYTIGGAVSHCAIEDKYDNAGNWCGETPHLLKGGAVSHCATETMYNDVDNGCGGTPHLLKGGAVSHCATEDKYDNADNWCGGTPHLLMADLVEQFEADWTEKFMQLHANEEQLNREFISIYGLEDELSPDVPLSEITILQQGEISIE